MPLITVVMLVLTLVKGLQVGIGAPGSQRESKVQALQDNMDWWRRHGLLALVLFALVVWLGGHSPLERSPSH